jgi:hypothetical protein
VGGCGLVARPTSAPCVSLGLVLETAKVWSIANPGSYVAHALMRAASRLVSMPVRGSKEKPSDDTSVDAARLGACAAKAFNTSIMSILCDVLH